VVVAALQVGADRDQGLRKLQLIREARQMCPDVVIVLGEDLTRFRNASKDLYSFLRAFSWNSKVERLGFDEVRWSHVTLTLALCPAPPPNNSLLLLPNT
jgi:DNA polymerase iota